MRIVQVKTNGICNPVGFSLDRIQCSWKVEEIEEGKQQNAVILVSTDEEFQQIVYRKEGAQLKSSGEVLDFSPLPCTRHYGRIEVSSDTGESAASDIFWFESGKRKEEWSAEWITQQKQDAFPPEFVKEFKTEKLIQRARLYISGLGLYEAYINGEKAGDELLAPFTSDYDEKIQYQTYDVTGLLGKENTLSVICGNGWYKGRLGYEGHRRACDPLFRRNQRNGHNG